MWKNIHRNLLLMIIVLASGCNPLGSKTLTNIPDNEDLRSSTPTSEVSQVVAEPINVVFSPVKIPYQDKKEFESYPDFQLLVKTSEGDVGIFNFPNKNIERIQLVPDSIVDYPVVSPDGTLMAFIISQDEKKYLQIQKFSSVSDVISVSLPREAVVVRWLSKNKIAVWGGAPDWECLHFLLVIDTTTAEINQPKYTMPDLGPQECIQLPVQNPNGTQMIYPWQSFDFQTGITTDVFLFFKDFPKSPPAYSLRWKDDYVSIVYANNDTLYYLLDTPITEISMKKTPKIVSLPGLATKGGWWQSIAWWQNQTKIGIDLIDPKTDPLELLVSGQQVPTRFYVLDLDNRKIIDYGLDRGVFVQGSSVQKISAGFPSPDEEYYVWTIYDSVSGLPTGSRVLELSSGFVLSIPNVEALGWVVSN